MLTSKTRYPQLGTRQDVNPQESQFNGPPLAEFDMGYVKPPLGV